MFERAHRENFDGVITADDSPLIEHNDWKLSLTAVNLTPDTLMNKNAKNYDAPLAYEREVDMLSEGQVCPTITYRVDADFQLWSCTKYESVQANYNGSTSSDPSNGVSVRATKSLFEAFAGKKGGFDQDRIKAKVDAAKKVGRTIKVQFWFVGTTVRTGEAELHAKKYNDHLRLVRHCSTIGGLNANDPTETPGAGFLYWFRIHV